MGPSSSALPPWQGKVSAQPRDLGLITPGVDTVAAAIQHPGKRSAVPHPNPEGPSSCARGDVKWRPLLTAMVLLICSALFNPAMAAASTAPPRQVLTFSILSAEDQQSMSTYWQPLLDDMQAETGLTIKAFYSSSYSTLVQAMAFNQTQVGWFSADPAVEAIRRAHGEVFARTIDDHGQGFYQSVILARKGSGLTLDRLLKCDHTLSFGLGDPSSTSGTLAPLYYLFNPRHIDPERCFKTVRSASHQNNMLSVSNGTVDAATNNSVGLAYYRTGAPAVQAAVNRTEVIWTSPDLPESAIVFRTDLAPEIKAKLRQFFTTYGHAPGPEGDRQRAVLKKLKYSAFAPANNHYLKPVIDMELAVALAQSHAKPGATLGEIVRSAALKVATGRSWVAWAVLILAGLVGVAALAPRDKSLAQIKSPMDTALDVLVWGGVILLLIVSFAPVEMAKLPLIFSNSANMQTFAGAFFHPDFRQLTDYVAAMWLTIQIALWGTFIAIILAIPLGLLAARNVSPPWIQQPVRRVLDLLRAVPDLVIGTMFIVAVGLGPFAGVMALAINTGGVLGKLFSEAVESIDPQPVEGVRAVGAAPIHEVIWGIFPQVGPLWTSYALYRFESNARSATVLGLIGAGGIGQLLFDSLNAFKYSETAAIIVVIVVAVSLIDLLSQALRTRLM
jgi:phosphonate transport system permease protein